MKALCISRERKNGSEQEVVAFLIPLILIAAGASYFDLFRRSACMFDAL
ncbi:hypothetical protein HMPREF9554_00469 [Treponema phagedenis F0421]|nr:hypothetical protein HMPREF9554_00469 [Treponema phagedenis F0421]